MISGFYRKCVSFFTTVALSAGLLSALPSSAYWEGQPLGDCNFDSSVNVDDVRILREALVGNTEVARLSASAADVNADGQINAVDLALVKSKILTVPKKPKVTMLVYQCGSNLESAGNQATEDFNEMCRARLSDDFTVVLETGGAKKWSNGFSDADANYRITLDKNGATARKSSDTPRGMGETDTLLNFIREETAAHPADRYALVIWDHGGGPFYGACFDELTDDTLLVSEMTDALHQSGIHFDLIGFDACIMASAEVAYALRNYADYMVASEDSENGFGWYYKEFLTRWAADTAMPTVDVSKMIVDEMMNFDRRMWQKATLAVFDLSKAENMMNALYGYIGDVYKMYAEQGISSIKQIRSKTLEFGEQEYDLVDIGEFTKNLQTEHSQSVQDALREILVYKADVLQPGASGMSMWFFNSHPELYFYLEYIYAALGIDSGYAWQMKQMGQAAMGGWPWYMTQSVDGGIFETDDPVVRAGLRGLQEMVDRRTT